MIYWIIEPNVVRLANVWSILNIVAMGLANIQQRRVIMIHQVITFWFHFDVCTYSNEKIAWCYHKVMCLHGIISRPSFGAHKIIHNWNSIELLPHHCHQQSARLDLAWWIYQMHCHFLFHLISLRKFQMPSGVDKHFYLLVKYELTD